MNKLKHWEVKYKTIYSHREPFSELKTAPPVPSPSLHLLSTPFSSTSLLFILFFLFFLSSSSSCSFASIQLLLPPALPLHTLWRSSQGSCADEPVNTLNVPGLNTAPKPHAYRLHSCPQILPWTDTDRTDKDLWYI